MKKRILALVLIVLFIFSSNVFAYKWEEKGGKWYMLSENDKYVKGTLLDMGNGVYYFDDDGIMITGWWKNKNSNKYYFFDNKVDRNLGGMIFGLHMIDGYFHYFNANGSLATSDKKGELKKVFQDYYADYDGYLYQNDVRLRDTSVNKSEYYSNALYYGNENLNNYYLATYDEGSIAKISNATSHSSVNTDNATDVKNKSADTHLTSGGVNYNVDEWGHVNVYDKEPETRPFEKFGPMKVE